MYLILKGIWNNSWSFNYFFYNKELRKVLFFACTAKRFISVFILIIVLSNQVNHMLIFLLWVKRMALMMNLLISSCILSIMCCFLCLFGQFENSLDFWRFYSSYESCISSIDSSRIRRSNKLTGWSLERWSEKQLQHVRMFHLIIHM